VSGTDAVTVTTVVAAEPSRAFAIFTDEVDGWWKPGDRLVLSWRNENFEPDQVTEVDVRFEPVVGGTRVTLVHRGWDSLPAGHEARHGLEGRAFSGMIGGWWGELAMSFRSRAARDRGVQG
jgi:hypothetical protein